MESIFISYARRDAADTASRLKSDLESLGYKVWLDTAKIAGGKSWSREIEQAIDECDVVLALLSKASFLSEICRAEHLRGLRKGKLLIPLLLDVDAERPLYLEHLNYRDLSELINYKKVLQTILGDIRNKAIITLPENKRFTLLSVPALPSYYIRREDDIETLKTALISDDITSNNPPVVLRGMGGLGKTELTKALCYDESIQAAFPDGIIWISIGRKPLMLVEKFKDIARILKDDTSHYSSEQSSIVRLQSLLRDKAVLLVLDDVWNTEHASSFLISGTNCRLLITTRDRNISLRLNAHDIKLGPMKSELAIKLLQERSGRSDPAFPQIADKLGNLPLALDLAGARLREGITGETWLKTFQRVSQIRLGRRSVDPQENLQVCFELSVEQLREEDRSLFYILGIFPEDIEIPEYTITRLWKHIDNDISTFDCNELLIDLSRLSLAEYNLETQTLALHDLIHDFVKEKIDDYFVSANINLLKAYNPSSLPWHEIEVDDYLQTYLSFHLINANLVADLLAILTDSPYWAEVDLVRKNDIRPYLNDIDLAYDHFTQDATNAGTITALVKLKAAAITIPHKEIYFSAEDLQTLVYIGEVDKALNYLESRNSSFSSKVVVFLACRDLGIQKDDLLKEILNENGMNLDKETHLIFLLTKAQLTEFLSEDDQTKQLLYEALRIAQSLQSDWLKPIYLLRIVEKLVSLSPKSEVAKLISEVEKEILAGDDLDRRVHNLGTLANIYVQQDDEETAKKVFNRALNYAARIGRVSEMIRELCTLSTTLLATEWPEVTHLLGYVRERIDSTNWNKSGDRDFALRFLAEALAEKGEFALAEETVQQIEEESHRAISLAEVQNVQANSLIRLQMLAEAEKVIDNMPSDHKKAEGFHVLALAFAKAGNKVKALSSLDKSHELERQLHEAMYANHQMGTQAISIRKFLQILTEQGRIESALQMASTVTQGWKRAEMYVSIGISAAKTDDYSNTERVIRLISQEDAGEKIHVPILIEWAKSLFKTNKQEAAKSIVQQIEETLRRQSEIYQQVAMKCSLTEVLIAAGEIQQANKLMTEIETDIPQISDHHYQNYARIQSMIIYALLGKEDLVNDMLRYSLAESYIGDFCVHLSLCAISNSSWMINILEIATEMIQAITSLQTKSYELRELARAYANIKNIEQAIKLVNVIPDERIQGYAMDDILEIESLQLVEQGKYVDALSIFFSQSRSERIDEFMIFLCDCHDYFDKVESGLGINILQEAIKIFGWTRQDWKQISDTIHN